MTSALVYTIRHKPTGGYLSDDAKGGAASVALILDEGTATPRTYPTEENASKALGVWVAKQVPQGATAARYKKIQAEYEVASARLVLR